MLEELREFNGKIILNGKSYAKDTLPDLDKFETLDIYLEASDEEELSPVKNKLYEFTVKEDMTEFGKGQVNFHKRWNKEIAMPYRRMVGKIIEEYDTMLKLSLDKAGMHWEGYVLKDYIDSIKELKDE